MYTNLSSQNVTSRGKFITLEGIEGVGKSTNVAFIRDVLQQHGIRVTTTREPGGTPLAEKLRELLLLQWQESITSQTELMLLFAGRAQHLHEIIEPALSRGEWVICDRFTDATYAYQGYGRGLPLEEIRILEKSVQKGIYPDLTLLFDAPVEVGQQRIQSRDDQKDRFEIEQNAFFERVRQGYLQRAANFKERFQIIQATEPLEQVQSQIKEALVPLLTAESLQT